ncbi:PAN domain-containing protein, partial [Escherichia coli]|uniref:PAN domain-containing protein n=1 Tax=Escherichia coli TaxID=562 RepID=UPI0034D965AD
MRANRDLFGNDIRNIDGGIGFPSDNLNSCAKRCSQTSACVAVSFNGWNKRCFMKNNLAETVLDPHSTIA